MKPSYALCGGLLVAAGLSAFLRPAAPQSPTNTHAKPSRALERAAHGGPRRVDARELVTRDPATARARAVAWIQEKPALAEERAAELLGELARSGHPDLAAGIALELDEPRAPLELALSIHSATDPLAAWALAERIADRDLQSHARETVLTRGSDAFLPQLAGLAQSSESPALTSVLSRWALQDPAALSAWLNENDVPQYARDQAASHLVLRGDSENRSPEVAAAWAASIADPELRREAMQAAAAEQPDR